MAKVKVSYFDITALGEPIRFLLTYGGTAFEDNRVQKTNWPELKPSMPFGQMPVYEENGRVACQSIAICRYLGKKYNLVGGNDWENLEIDAIADTFKDLVLKIGQYHYEEDAAVKETKKELLFKETLPYYLEKLDNIAKENNGHLALTKLTWADFFFAGLIGYVNVLVQVDIIDNCPNLAAVRDNVYNLPAIKAWIETHPQ